MNLVINNILNKIFSATNNVVSNGKYKLSYITETKDWVIKQVGEELISFLKESNLIEARTTLTHSGLRDQIVHFGSVNTFLKKDGFHKPHSSNKVILTWFHFVPEDKKNKNIIRAQKHLNFIHTACTITKNNLINLGVDPERIIVIPLGIDLSLFKSVSFEEKQNLKKQLGIPPDKIVIGSFQKDGIGWGEGWEPKLIKGPDIFVAVAEKLAKNYPIFVLLVGPARGYIKNELQKRNIPYKNIGYLKDFKEIAKYYQVLDLYLITSRIEGGPKQILEGWAAGIPVISTKVGMIPDIAEDGVNILLTNTEDVDQIIQKTEQIITNKNLKEKLIENGFKTVQNYSWDRVTRRYYNEIYSKLIK